MRPTSISFFRQRFTQISSASTSFIAVPTKTLFCVATTSTSTTSIGMFHNTSISLSNPDWFKQKKQRILADRQRRELERQGIDVDDDADGDWADPEEQARLDAEKAEKEKLRREQEDEIRAKRDKLDAEKKSKFKNFRAKQIAKSEKLREDLKAKREAEAATGAVNAAAFGRNVAASDDSAALAASEKKKEKEAEEEANKKAQQEQQQEQEEEGDDDDANADEEEGSAK